MLYMVCIHIHVCMQVCVYLYNLYIYVTMVKENKALNLVGGGLSDIRWPE